MYIAANKCLYDHRGQNNVIICIIHWRKCVKSIDDNINFIFLSEYYMTYWNH